MTSSAIEKSPCIRPAAEHDVAAIAAIYGHYATGTCATFDVEAPGEDQWRQRLAGIASAGLPFLVTEAGGRVAGYAYVTPWKVKLAYRHTVENSIYLAPWAIGRGLGGPLLDALLAACEAADVRQVIAVVADTGNPSSLALHMRRGFTDAGRLRQVGWKHGRWLDTVLLQRSLGPDVVADARGTE